MALGAMLRRHLTDRPIPGRLREHRVAATHLRRADGDRERMYRGSPVRGVRGRDVLKQRRRPRDTREEPKFDHDGFATIFTMCAVVPGARSLQPGDPCVGRRASLGSEPGQRLSVQGAIETSEDGGSVAGCLDVVWLDSTMMIS